MCNQINEMSFELQIETILMLMIFAVVLRYFSSSGIAEVRLRVPFRPECFRPIFLYCRSSVAQQQRSLTLKLFPSVVQIIFH